MSLILTSYGRNEMLRLIRNAVRAELRGYGKRRLVAEVTPAVAPNPGGNGEPIKTKRSVQMAPSDQLALVSLYNQGRISRAGVCRKFHISGSTLQKILNLHGWKRRRAPGGQGKRYASYRARVAPAKRIGRKPVVMLTDAQKIEAVKLVKSGEARKDVAKAYNISRGTMDNLLSGRYWKPPASLAAQG